MCVCGGGGGGVGEGKLIENWTKQLSMAVRGYVRLINLGQQRFYTYSYRQTG